MRGALLALALAVWVGAGAAQNQDVSLAGAIDFHVHSGPDSRPRSVTDLEVARMTQRAGMRGIVLKNHFTMTADGAALAMDQVDDLEIFGAVVLNRAVTVIGWGPSPPSGSAAKRAPGGFVNVPITNSAWRR